MTGANFFQVFPWREAREWKRQLPVLKAPVSCHLFSSKAPPIDGHLSLHYVKIRIFQEVSYSDIFRPTSSHLSI